MNYHNKKQSGYIALMATIIISLILLVMTVQAGSSGWSARFNVLGTEAKEQANALAEGCGEQALATVLTNPNYAGDPTGTWTTVGEGKCHIFAPDFSIAGLVVIKTQAVVRDSYANINMSMSTNDIKFGAVTHTTGTLYITTHVINHTVSGGKQAVDSTVSVIGVNSSKTSFPGSEGGVAVGVDPGSFSITGSSIPGYKMTTIGDCSGNIPAQVIKFCTITYTDTTLTFMVSVINGYGGNKTSSSFPLTIPGITSPVALNQAIPVSAGAYTIPTTLPANYGIKQWSYDCSLGKISMNSGDNKTCIVTFAELPPPTPDCAETVMMLDRSGSMFTNSAWIPDEKTAAKSLVDLYSTVSILPKISFGRFGDTATGVSAEIVTQLTSLYTTIKTAIDNGLPSFPTSYTNLAAAITAGNNELNSARHVAGKEKVLILISDGSPNQPTGNTSSTLKLHPSLEGTSTAWSANTGTKIDAISADDSDTTYITTSTAAQTFLFSSANLPANATNISVTLHAVAKRASGTSASIALMAENGVSSSFDGGHSLTSTTTYTDYAWSMSTNPLNGNAWTIGDGSDNDVNNWKTKFGVFNTSSVGNIPRVTQIYVMVSYSTVTNGNLFKSPSSTMSGGQWSNATNAYTSNNIYATDTSIGHQQGYSNFGFSIPTGAAITGIQVNTDAKISGTPTPQTATIYPSAQGSQAAWTNGETVIDETGTPNCSSSDSIYTSTVNARESAVLNLSSIPDGSIITSININSYDKADTTSGGTYKTFARLNSTNYDATTTLTSGTTSSSSTCNGVKTQLITLPNLVKSATTSLEIGVVKVSGSNNVVRVGALNAIVTYTPPTDGSISVMISPNNGGTWTSTKSVDVTTTQSVSSPVGNSNTDLWGRVWVPNDFNNGNFTLRVVNNSTAGLTTSLDQVTVNVYYNTTSVATPILTTPLVLGTYNNWSPNTGTAITATVTNDSDTTSISNTSVASGAQTFAFPSMTIPSGATNVQVSLHAVSKEVNGTNGNIKLMAENGSAQTMDTGHSLSSSYTDYSWTATNPLGGSWTTTVLNNTRFGIKDNSTLNTIPRVTELYIILSYDLSTDPTSAALNAADNAKLQDVNIFTIYFGSGNPTLLAQLATGTVANSGHQPGSDNTPGGGAVGDTGQISTTTSVAPNQFTNPTRAYISDNSYATDTVNGHQQGYSGFNLPVAPTSTISGVSIEVEAKSSDTSGCQVGVEVSSDGGTTFSSSGSVSNVTGSDTFYTLGGATSLWGKAWSSSDFTAGSFVVRLQNIDPGNACINNSTLSIDRVRARVYSSAPLVENSDGDHFFISPTSADMHGIFDYIGEQVCPALLNLDAATPPTTGTLIVLTQVINDTPAPYTGTKALTDFTVNISANAPSQSSLSSSTVPRITGFDSITVNPGDYNISENSMSGYDESYSDTCSSSNPLMGPIAAGETRVCIITNDDLLPAANLNLNPSSWSEVPVI